MDNFLFFFVTHSYIFICRSYPYFRFYFAAPTVERLPVIDAPQLAIYRPTNRNYTLYQYPFAELQNEKHQQQQQHHLPRPLQQRKKMSSEEDKPPAPPVRLTSNRGGDRVGGVINTGVGVGGAGDGPPVDMRPLPKGKCVYLVFNFFKYFFLAN